MAAIHEIDDFLAGGGAKSATFPTVGTTYEGIIVHLDKRPETEYQSKRVKTWDDGNVREQLVVTIQTDARSDEDDDGRRSVYVKGAMLTALRKAVGAGKLRPGGFFKVQYWKDGEKQEGLNAQKLYRVRYEPPALPLPEAHGYDDPGPDEDSMPF